MRYINWSLQIHTISMYELMEYNINKFIHLIWEQIKLK